MPARTRPPGAASTEAGRAAALRALRRTLGAQVSTAEAALRRASIDGMRIAFLPEAVVRARRAEDVGTLLRLANRHGVPVTVRGAGSSLTGSAAPCRGGWVLDLSGLRRLRVDPECGMVRAEAGVVVADLQRAAEAKGWMYPPDPSSKKYCTIGGTIACNAGGLHGAKYGVTRDYVLALEGYLPTGEAVRWGRPLRKFAAGYNLRDLWIGSEGTLGIITAATLRLVPLPECRWTLAAAFADEAAALRAARRLLRERIVPAICEYLDALSVGCAEQASGQALFPQARGRPLLLVELAGTQAEVARDRLRVETWAGQFALAWERAEDAAERERLWTLRRRCSKAMFALGDGKLNEDVVVPPRAYLAFSRRIRAISRKHRIPMPTFGHAADGNFHVNLMFHRETPGEPRRARAALQELMETVVSLGGAISGEHGIGLAKSPFLRLDSRPAEVAAMLAVKQALDPKGILNPGKIFEPVEVWKRRPEKVQLPWDAL